MRTAGSSLSATTAITYGGTNAGCHGWWFTVNASTTAVPPMSCTSSAVDRQVGHLGPGGNSTSPQSRHRCMRSTPSAPERQ
jgi:hypothetical protein